MSNKEKETNELKEEELEKVFGGTSYGSCNRIIVIGCVCKWYNEEDDQCEKCLGSPRNCKRH